MMDDMRRNTDGGDWEKKLENAATFQTTHLVFDEDSVEVRTTWKYLLFTEVFSGIGAFLLALFWLQKAWPLLVAGCFLSLIGIGILCKALFAKQPFIDLETRQFFPEGKRGEALPVGIGEFHHLEIVSKSLKRRSKHGTYNYSVYSLNAVTRGGRRYAILQHGSEKYMREDAKRLAEVLFLSLDEREAEPATPPGDFTKAVQKNKKLLFFPRILFGLAFLTVGIVFGWLEVGSPCRKAIASRSWPTTTATIISSSLKSSSNRKGTTYKIYIEFEYQVDDVSYVSDQYDCFCSMYTNVGVARMREVVQQHPKGAEVLCRYDAENPSEAIISSEIPARVWLFGLFFLVFTFPGVFVIWMTLKEK